jgi:hypothetical protein
MKNIQKFTTRQLILNSDQHQQLSSTLQDLCLLEGSSCNLNHVLFDFDRLKSLNWNIEARNYYSHADPMLIYNDEFVAYPHLISLQSDHKVFQGNFVNLLDAVPNLQLLCLNAQNIPCSPENLEKLLSMSKLEYITITLQLPSQNQNDQAAINVSNYLELIKDLCKKLKKFAIKFTGYYSDLIQSLDAEFSSSNVCDFEHGDYRNRGYFLKSR